MNGNGYARVLRMATCQVEALRAHARGAGRNETMGFLLCGRANGNRLVVREVLLPDDGDLEVATPGLVRAANGFKKAAWRRALDENLTIVDLHTHVPPVAPRFSGTDLRGFRENADIVRREFSEPVAFGGVVVDPTLRRFSGLLWEPSDREFHEIGTLEVVGSRIEELYAEGPSGAGRQTTDGERYARHRLIPGFDQEAFGRLRVAVVGCGGNGAQVIQALAGMGVGSGGGQLVLIDGDTVDPSTLNRLPFATPADVGRGKAEVSAEFVRRHNPDISVAAIPEFLAPEKPCPELRECQVVFGCGDHAGVRKLLLEEALVCLLVYVDLGCEIRSTKDGGYESGGQVRVFLPGETGCAVCYGQLDLAQAALDLLPSSEKQARRAMGYFDQGDAPTPSVVHLNMAVAALAVNLFTKLVSGEDVRATAFTHYDARTVKAFGARMAPTDGCLLCGPDGPFGRGDAWYLSTVPMPSEIADATLDAIRPPVSDDVETILLDCLTWWGRLLYHLRRRWRAA